MAAKKAKKVKATKKVVGKKVAAKAVKTSTKVGPYKTRISKSELFTTLADANGLKRKEVVGIFETLQQIIKAHLGKTGPGEFVLPGLLKMHTVKKPATKARKGINPFTGQETTFKAKPASVRLKIRPLKVAKDMVN